MSEREFQTAFNPDFLADYQTGTLKYTYKGVRCIKSPVDMALYMLLIWNLRPRTLIEIGTKEGGSALWFADVVRNYGLDCPVFSIDLDPPELVVDQNVTFLQGDVRALGPIIDKSEIDAERRPWFVVEDSAHTFEGCLATLNTFSSLMTSGDVLVIEDGVLDELGLSENYQGGPNRAIEHFISSKPGQFSVMRDYCDFYGKNATYNPNGYLLKL